MLGAPEVLGKLRQSVTLAKEKQPNQREDYYHHPMRQDSGSAWGGGVGGGGRRSDSVFLFVYFFLFVLFDSEQDLLTGAGSERTGFQGGPKV